MKAPGKMLKEVLSHITKAPATIKYPAEKAEMPDQFRGQIRFIAENCIGCKLCEKDCPSDAIEIKKVGDKRFEAFFDLDKCIYCAQCVFSCAKKALEATKQFELASLDRSKLRVVFRGQMPPPAATTKSAEPTDSTSENLKTKE